MTSEKLQAVMQWFDLLLKAVIGIGVTIMGVVFKDLYNDNRAHTQKIAVIEANGINRDNRLNGMDTRLDRFESKIDRIWEAVRK